MTDERLKALEYEAHQWHAECEEIADELIAEIDRLQNIERISLRQCEQIVDMQANIGRLTVKADAEGAEVVKLKAELAEAKKILIHCVSTAPEWGNRKCDWLESHKEGE